MNQIIRQKSPRITTKGKDSIVSDNKGTIQATRELCHTAIRILQCAKDPKTGMYDLYDLKTTYRIVTDPTMPTNAFQQIHTRTTTMLQMPYFESYHNGLKEQSQML